MLVSATHISYIHIPIHWYSCNWRNYLLPVLTKMYNLWLFEGPWGPFNDQTGPILFPSYPSIYIYVHVSNLIRKQSDKNFLRLNPKYEQNIIIFIFGGSWGALTSNPRLPIFYGSMTLWHIYVQQGKKITTSYSCKSLNVILFCIFGYFGGGGGLGTLSINRMGTTCFPTIHSPISIYI